MSPPHLPFIVEGSGERSGAMSNGLQRVIIGVPWVDREDYTHLQTMILEGAECRTVFRKPEAVPPDWTAWVRQVDEEVGRIEARGYGILRVPLRPELFRAWCRNRGLIVSMAAVRQYARELAFEVCIGLRAVKSIK